MQIKLIVSAAALALAAGLGSASAADRFTALEGITAEPLNAVELGRVRGTNIDLSGLDGVPYSVVLAVGLKTARMPGNVCPPGAGCLN